MSAPVSSLPASPSRAAPIPIARWLAAGSLILGGAAAFVASFLPFGRATRPATAATPASTTVVILAQDLTAAIEHAQRSSDAYSVGSTGLWAFWLWGTPLVLVTLGAVALLLRRWTPGPRTRIIGLFVVAVGVGFILASCLEYLAPISGPQGATQTLAYGPAVASLGYLCALVGAIWLPAAARQAG
jgi:hypothetical protein